MERNHVGSETHGYHIMRSHADNNTFTTIYTTTNERYVTRTQTHQRTTR